MNPTQAIHNVSCNTRVLPDPSLSAVQWVVQLTPSTALGLFPTSCGFWCRACNVMCFIIAKLSYLLKKIGMPDCIQSRWGLHGGALSGKQDINNCAAAEIVWTPLCHTFPWSQQHQTPGHESCHKRKQTGHEVIAHKHKQSLTITNTADLTNSIHLLYKSLYCPLVHINLCNEALSLATYFSSLSSPISLPYLSCMANITL